MYNFYYVLNFIIIFSEINPNFLKYIWVYNLYVDIIDKNNIVIIISGLYAPLYKIKFNKKKLIRICALFLIK